MLTHASATIGRLEGRWRAPGAVREGQIALVVVKSSLEVLTAMYHGSMDEPSAWHLRNRQVVDVLAWCELPPIPADEMFKELI